MTSLADNLDSIEYVHVSNHFRAMVGAYDKLSASLNDLWQAIEIVTEKIRSMQNTQESVVLLTLVEHPGALERIIAKLVQRAEGYIAEAKESCRRSLQRCTNIRK
eukprot:1780028-Amphidinium_carterae.1